MHGLTIKKQITANFSAEQWSLYTSSYLPECIDAAKELNKALEDAVNSGGDRWSCFKQVNIAMQRFENLGATDTEPREFLYDVLDQIFPEQIVRF